MASCWVIVLPPWRTPPALDIGDHRAADGARIDAPMAVEAAVLDGDEGRGRQRIELGDLDRLVLDRAAPGDRPALVGRPAASPGRRAARARATSGAVTISQSSVTSSSAPRSILKPQRHQRRLRPLGLLRRRCSPGGTNCAKGSGRILDIGAAALPDAMSLVPDRPPFLPFRRASVAAALPYISKTVAPEYPVVDEPARLRLNPGRWPPSASAAACIAATLARLCVAGCLRSQLGRAQPSRRDRPGAQSWSNRHGAAVRRRCAGPVQHGAGAGAVRRARPGRSRARRALERQRRRPQLYFPAADRRMAGRPQDHAPTTSRGSSAASSLRAAPTRSRTRWARSAKSSR